MHRYGNLSEQELIRLLQTGDEVAFTEVYNRYWERLIATAYFYTRSTQLAEDIVHDVMLSLWNRRNRVRIESLQAYLATAVKFSVFKSIARQKQYRHLTDDITTTTDDNIEHRLDAKFEEEYLRGVVEQLSDTTRLVFEYRRNDNLSVKDIAEKLDVSEKAIEYHITKALKLLKRAFKKIKLLFV